MAPSTTRAEELTRQALRHPMVTSSRVVHSPSSGFFCVSHMTGAPFGQFCDACAWAEEMNKLIEDAKWP